MKRTYKDYVLDILSSIQEIRDFVGEMGFEDFVNDKKTVNAVIRSLEVMGEAAKKISPEIKEKHAEIPWKYIAGMRDKLVHEYHGVDLEIVWEVVTKEIPPLKPKFEKVLEELE
mgnify:CR=1 FL=1